MRLGFVGSGTITAAIVEGLSAAKADVSIVLSPRNAAVAGALAARYSNVRVADCNQTVLDESEVVVIAVRPQIVEEVLQQLRFRPDHRVVSLVARVSLQYLQRATHPASRVTRAVPLPSVARRQGPTAIFPPADDVVALFDPLGTAIAVEQEAVFNVFGTATAVMASYFAFAGTISGWMERHGVAHETARAFVRQMLEGLATAGPDRTFEELADEHQTRGGINEQVVRAVAKEGVISSLDEALDAALASMQRGSTKGS